jgi:hypothetical protein
MPLSPVTREEQFLADIAVVLGEIRDRLPERPASPQAGSAIEITEPAKQPTRRKSGR